MSNLLSIKGRTAFVTGAGQGVGRQVALYLAEHGAGAIVVNDFHAERAESVAAEVEAAGAKALPLAFDVSDFDAVGAAFAETQTTFGGVDILVNNAGNAGPTSRLDDLVPFWESDPDEWRRWMATNFDGVLNCTRHAMPLMVNSGYGRIVTVISDAGRVGEPHLAVYSGAKAGAAGFMRAIAKAGGRFGITANCVALGGTRTPAVADLIPDAETEKRALSQYVIRRLGEPEEIARCVAFLASEDSGFISGSTISGSTIPL